MIIKCVFIAPHITYKGKVSFVHTLHIRQLMAGPNATTINQCFLYLTSRL